MEQLSEDFVFSCIQPRAQESHKGSYGHVLLAAGSRRYRGAANLAAEGALRSGAGIVTLAAIEPVIAAAAARLPFAPSPAIFPKLHNLRPLQIECLRVYSMVEWVYMRTKKETA